MDEAKQKCDESSDCFAIATQKSQCDGKFRISHGGPTIIDYTEQYEKDIAGDMFVYVKFIPCDGTKFNSNYHYNLSARMFFKIFSL